MNIEQYRADYIFHNVVSNLSTHHFLPRFSISLSPFITLIVFGLLLAVAFYMLRKFLLWKYNWAQKSVFLELTPPAFTDKSAFTTEQLFSVIHNMGSQQSVIDKVLGKKNVFSLEIVSTREQGIRYIIRTTDDEANIFQHNIFAYMPYVKVSKVSDYFPQNLDRRKAAISEFTLQKHFAYPLAKQNMLNQHDPVAYVTGMMTQLKAGEIIALQIVVSPTSNAETDTISQKILRNEDVLAYLDRIRLPWFVVPFTFVFTVIGKCFQAAMWVINDFSLSKDQRYAMQNATYMNYQIMAKVRPARTLSSFEQELIGSIQKKSDQLLFQTTIRSFVYVNDSVVRKQRTKGIRSALASFSVPKYQSLQAKWNILPFVTNTMRLATFDKRLLSFFNNSSSSLLSESEIADLYHFPFTNTTKTENIVKVYSKELPAPLSLKKDKKNLDSIFAKNTYGEQTTMVGLTEEERRRHVYIIGATGAGKSTMILSMVNQDLQNGKGLGVIDPHGELAETILNLIPEDRNDDLVYVNPDDLEYPIGINLMELTPGLSEEDSLREKEFIAESVISLFRKVFASDMKGNPHRIEYILRNTIHTAFTVEQPTLFTIFDLLNNPVYQRKVVAKLQDQHLKDFWKYEYGKAGDYQKVKMVSPVTARIGRFLFSPSAKRILEQTKSTINFDEILNGKILICNLAKGKLGEDTSQVLGIMILNKLQLASLKRARIEAKERKDFYLYVDEFQHFATKSFVEMLSESRKYKLNLTIAEQSTSQQDDKDLVHIILANVGTVICFKTANPQDEKLMLPQFEPYVAQGEIYNLPAFHFYIKVSALHPEEPFSGETILLNVSENKEKVQSLIDTSRKNYALKYEAKLQIPTEEEADEKENTSNSSNARGKFPKRKKR